MIWYSRGPFSGLAFSPPAATNSNCVLMTPGVLWLLAVSWGHTVYDSDLRTIASLRRQLSSIRPRCSSSCSEHDRGWSRTTRGRCSRTFWCDEGYNLDWEMLIWLYFGRIDEDKDKILGEGPGVLYTGQEEKSQISYFTLSSQVLSNNQRCTTVPRPWLPE